MKVTVFSTKRYDQQYLNAGNARSSHEFLFLEDRLHRATAPLAAGAEAVCAFVNDVLDAPTLEILARGGTRLIIYRSKFNPKINRNFEVFDPVDFLALLAQHIPDQGAQMVRYYGLCSNKSRGCAGKGTGRARYLPVDPAAWPKSSPPPPAKLPSRKWRDLIRQAWHTDPLQCPRCQQSM